MKSTIVPIASSVACIGLIGVAATPAVALPAAPVPTVVRAAITDPGYRVAAVTLSRTSVATSGTKTVPVTVTVRLTWNVADKLNFMGDPPVVLLERTGGKAPTDQALAARHVAVRRSGGVDGDAVFTGTMQVPSTMAGVYTVTHVYRGKQAHQADPGDMGLPDAVAVTSGPSIRVTGTHVPTFVGLGSSPATLPATRAPFGVTGGVVDSSTGRPFRGSRIRVTVARCGDVFAVASTVGGAVTDRTTGRFLLGNVPRRTATDAYCAALTTDVNDPFGGAFVWQRIPVRAAVAITAAPVKSSVPAGQTTAIKGMVLPMGVSGLLQSEEPALPDKWQVELQRQYARGVWRTVSTDALRWRHDYRVTAQPPTRKRYLYRVVLRANGIYVPVTSAPISITGY